MKRVYALVLSAIMALSLASCSDSAKDSKADKSSAEAVTTTTATTTTTTTAPVTEASSEEPESSVPDDSELAAEQQEQLLGDWHYSTIDEETLSFNADGTGKYSSIVSGTEHIFKYTVYISHKEFNNGEPYIDNMMKIEYNTGEVEDIIFEVREEYGKTILVFRNSESGEYSGVINFPDWHR